MDRYLVKTQHFDMVVGLEVWKVKDCVADTNLYGEPHWVVTVNPDNVVADDGYLRIIPSAKLSEAP